MCEGLIIGCRFYKQTSGPESCHQAPFSERIDARGLTESTGSAEMLKACSYMHFLCALFLKMSLSDFLPKCSTHWSASPLACSWISPIFVMSYSAFRLWQQGISTGSSCRQYNLLFWYSAGTNLQFQYSPLQQKSRGHLIRLAHLISLQHC